jgi:hypothetical protein
MNKYKNIKSSTLEKSIIILFFIVFYINSLGQDLTGSTNSKNNNLRKNAVFLEIGGQGGAGSINYERAFIKKNNFSLNGSIGIGGFSPYTHYNNNPIGFPARLTMNIYVFEIGIGTFSIIYNYDLPVWKSNLFSDIIYYINQPLIGLKFLNKKNFLFRFSYTPFLVVSEGDYNSHYGVGYFPGWFGFSFGYCF